MGLSAVAAVAQRTAADFEHYVDSTQLAYAGPDAHILHPTEVAGFHGIHFFPYDSAARVEARFLPVANAEAVAFPTSSGQTANYRPIGRLMFLFDGQACRLTVYEAVGRRPGMPNPPFVPLTDETSGVETYGGGRYMDLAPIASGQGTVTLDFNYTYHPYCAYSDQYNCPVPPSENALGVAVRAGARSWFAPLSRG